MVVGAGHDQGSSGQSQRGLGTGAGPRGIRVLALGPETSDTLAVLHMWSPAGGGGGGAPPGVGP